MSTSPGSGTGGGGVGGPGSEPRATAVSVRTGGGGGGSSGGCSRAQVVHNVLNQIGSLSGGVVQPGTSSGPHLDGGGGGGWGTSLEEGAVNLRKEAERLKTFDNWPVKFLESKKLASAGFYYLKRGDKVRCVFCGIEIGDWRPGDDPMGDHARWSDSCPFVNKQPTGNIPLRLSSDSNSQNRDSGFDECGPFERGSPESRDRLSEDPVLTESPHYLKNRPPSFPEYATLDARLRSYQTWPISLKLKPKVLTEAGFFYTGKGDQTICYHCGGGLKDWEETDEPWVEHARWFSKCPFVISLKGKDFVDQVCGKKAEEDLKCTQLTGLSLSSSTGDIEKVPTYTPTAGSKKSEEGKNEEREGGGGSSPTSSLCSRSSSRASPDVLLCKICYTGEVEAVFLPCGHMMACMKCALSLSTCAICRKPVTAFFRAFFS